MRYGAFLTFEGAEGAGKSSNLEAVRAHLARARLHLVVTREPGGTAIAEAIRELLLQPGAEPMATMTELLLMFAARAQHLQSVIRPALARGDWVLCDRFTDATYAYQGGGRGIDADVIATLETLVHGDLQPDLTLYYDLSPATGLRRHAGRELDRIERETLDFHARVRASYLARASHSNGRIRVVNAARPLPEVSAESISIVEAWRAAALPEAARP